MLTPPRRPHRASAAALSLLAVLVLAGCAAPPPPPPPPPPPAPTIDETLEGAVNSVLLQIGAQLGPLPAGSDATVVIDPLLDGRSGQQTGATEKALRTLAASMPRLLKSLQLLPFDEAGARQSRWLLNGTLTTVQGTPGRYTLTVALSDRRSGTVTARGSAPLLDAQLDLSPTRFYTESPALVSDRAVRGYLETTEKPVGQAADSLYLAQIPTAALLAEAQEAYNGERYDRALELMSVAAKRDDGQQLRTYNGLYMAHMRLGQLDQAEAAFGRIAAIGLATSNLAVKILFRPGTTEFLSEPATYAMWLRQIARAAQGSDLCLNVVGHTSKTGTEAVNRSLSLRRAQAMRDRLVREAPALGRGQRVRTEGRGWDETIVGTGTDDLRDALDRRVEFKVIGCT